MRIISPFSQLKGGLNNLGRKETRDCDALKPFHGEWPQCVSALAFPCGGY